MAEDTAESLKSLDAERLQALLAGLNGWQVRDGKLHKTFAFRNFVEAFAFMTKVALEAEKADHHPEWSNVYGEVTIDLVTHHTGGITQKDIDLAGAIDALL